MTRYTSAIIVVTAVLGALCWPVRAQEPRPSEQGRGQVKSADQGGRIDQPATPAEVRRAFDSGDYRGSLRLASQVLSSTSATTTTLSSEERYAVLMIRGESLLRLNERGYAIDA